MEIAIIAHDKKKELMAQFCIAYYNTLAKHNLSATATTASYVRDATGLEFERFLTGDYGGEDQIAARISYNEIDCLLYFRDTMPDNPTENDSIADYAAQEPHYYDANDLIRLCDIRNIPVATNIATAEILIRAIENGDLDWRNYVNAKTSRKFGR